MDHNPNVKPDVEIEIRVVGDLVAQIGFYAENGGEVVTAIVGVADESLRPALSEALRMATAAITRANFDAAQNPPPASTGASFFHD